MAESEKGSTLKVGDRVRRKLGFGSLGVVKEIRSEVTQSSLEPGRERGLIVCVLWDNGTFSNFVPGALEAAK